MIISILNVVIGVFLILLSPCSGKIECSVGGHIPPLIVPDVFYLPSFSQVSNLSVERQWKCVVTWLLHWVWLWPVGGWAKILAGSIAPLGLFSGCPWPWPAPATLCLRGTISLGSACLSLPQCSAPCRVTEIRTLREHFQWFLLGCCCCCFQQWVLQVT